LKADSLSWYPSSTVRSPSPLSFSSLKASALTQDPYFPLATLSLHYLTPSSIEPSRSNSKGFKILKSEAQGGGWEHFRADSEASRDEWVKAVRKAVWRWGVEGESVKVRLDDEDGRPRGARGPS
jgi:sterol 3beta-glucosyltransferase